MLGTALFVFFAACESLDRNTALVFALPCFFEV